MVERVDATILEEEIEVDKEGEDVVVVVVEGVATAEDDKEDEENEVVGVVWSASKWMFTWGSRARNVLRTFSSKSRVYVGDDSLLFDVCAN